VGLGRIELPTSALSVGSTGISADTEGQSHQVRALRRCSRNIANCCALAMDARWSKGDTELNSRFALETTIVLQMNLMAAASDAPLVTETKWLVGATALLALVTVLMAISTWRAAAATRDAAVATKETAVQTARLAEAAEDDLRQGHRLVEIGQNQADAARVQATASQTALARSSQPILVPVIEREIVHNRRLIAVDQEMWTVPQLREKAICSASSTDIWAVAPVRNVGTGTALINSNEGNLLLTSPRYGGIALPGRPSSGVIAPGDVVDLVFHSRQHLSDTSTSEASPASSAVVVEVRYEDVSGLRQARSRFSYGGSGDVLDVTEVSVLLPVED
jgi:hypothetical protein